MRAVVAIVVTVFAVYPASLFAQRVNAGGENCDLVRSTRLNSVLMGDSLRITYIDGPVLMECPDGTTIRADSVVSIPSNRFSQLFGQVSIEGPEISLRADRVNISDATRRTEAWGSVEAAGRESEIRMVGDSLIFLEAAPNQPQDHLTMLGTRPYAVLRLQGAGGASDADAVSDEPRSDDDVDVPDIPAPIDGPPGPAAGRAPSATPPDTVYADRLMLLGQTRFVGVGEVEVRRPNLVARGDSLDYDEDRSLAVLFSSAGRKASIDGDDYDLSARTVELVIRGQEVTEILAHEDAVLVGEDVEMDAPAIRIFLADGEMDRLVALGDPPPAPDSVADAASDSGSGPDDPPRRRAVALAEDFLLQADSIEVIAPYQRLEQVVAVGRARGESMAQDSLNTEETPDLIRRDWIEGRTVVAHFVPVAPPEAAGADGDGGGEARSGREFRLDRLVATGSARSLYRMAPRDTTRAADASGVEAEAVGDSSVVRPPRDRLAVHYVMGQEITIHLVEGEVERMEVVGQTQGIYLEPTRAVPADSVAAPIPAGDFPAPGSPPADPPNDGADGPTDPIAGGGDDSSGSPGGGR